MMVVPRLRVFILLPDSKRLSSNISRFSVVLPNLDTEVPWFAPKIGSSRNYFYVQLRGWTRDKPRAPRTVLSGPATPMYCTENASRPCEISDSRTNLGFNPSFFPTSRRQCCRASRSLRLPTLICNQHRRGDKDRRI